MQTVMPQETRFGNSWGTKKPIFYEMKLERNNSAFFEPIEKKVNRL
jgi:hypothetical protein